MLGPVKLADVETHRDVPVTQVADWARFTPSSESGVSKYSAPLPRGALLEALLVNRQSEVLVVSLHGATRRDKYELPRFEWFRTLRSRPWSILSFSDPTLRLSQHLALGWYTGWDEFDAASALAAWTEATACAIGARTIVFTGSSGGGFAALNLAPRVCGSIAVPFNPQTSIARYRPEHMGAQMAYARHVMPHLVPAGGVEKMVPGADYFASERRTRVIEPWVDANASYAWYASNRNDTHHHVDHFLPFKSAVSEGRNADRVVFDVYDGPAVHNPPPGPRFLRTLDNAIERFPNGATVS